MLLPDVLFILFLAGCWLLCLTDAALRPRPSSRAVQAHLDRLIAVTFIVGAIAWYSPAPAPSPVLAADAG